jgi:proteasome lid subunit RPN8/RPN11
MTLKIKIKSQEKVEPVDMAPPYDNIMFSAGVEKSVKSGGEITDGRQRLPVYVSQEVCNAIWKHARDLNMKYEMGGALIGFYCRDGKGSKDERFLVVTDVLNMPSEFFKSPALLRFTNEFMNQLDDYMEHLNKQDKRLRRLGFYHTHPGYGVFLSGTDIRTFEGIFKDDWQIAMVVDPVNEDEGVFYWQGGKISHKNGFYHFKIKPEPDPKPDDLSLEIHEVHEIDGFHPDLLSCNEHSLIKESTHAEKEKQPDEDIQPGEEIENAPPESQDGEADQQQEEQSEEQERNEIDNEDQTPEEEEQKKEAQEDEGNSHGNLDGEDQGEKKETLASEKKSKRPEAKSSKDTEEQLMLGSLEEAGKASAEVFTKPKF